MLLENAIDGLCGSEIEKCSAGFARLRILFFSFWRGYIGYAYPHYVPICILTLHFTISEPQNPTISEHFVAQKRRSIDFELLTWHNGQSGNIQIYVTHSPKTGWLEPLLAIAPYISLFCGSSDLVKVVRPQLGSYFKRHRCVLHTKNPTDIFSIF